MTPDPRPAARIRDSDLMRILHAERTKECAITGEVYGLELHHVLPRSSGGDDVRANLVFLTAEIHRRVSANDPVTLRLLGEHIRDFRPDTVEYLHRKLAERCGGWMARRLYIEEDE